MGFLIVGLLLLALWWADIGPVASLHWGWVALPFALAAGWWWFADSSGLSQRRAMRKMDEKKKARRQRDMEALGLNIQSAKNQRSARKASAQRPPAPPAPTPDPTRRDPRP